MVNAIEINKEEIKEIYAISFLNLQPIAYAMKEMKTEEMAITRSKFLTPSNNSGMKINDKKGVKRIFLLNMFIHNILSFIFFHFKILNFNLIGY